MPKFFSKQWLIYLGCNVVVFFYFYSHPIQEGSDTVFLVSLFLGLVLYVLTIPIQLTIWAYCKNFPPKYPDTEILQDLPPKRI